METIKRFISCHVPVSACNLKCPYCYVGQTGSDRRQILPFAREAKEMAGYLSRERLGGVCYFNLCGMGETMMHPQLIDLLYWLTRQGHYADIVTNGTLSAKFDELISRLSPEQQKHIMIKFSLHYLQLQKTGKMAAYLENVRKVKNSAMSYTIEITPDDELIGHIEEVKAFAQEQFGALPHISVARNEASSGWELLSRYDKEEYRRIWSVFDSPLFDFKMEIFGQKRTEFCHAGDWSFLLDLGSGVYRQCYCGAVLGNICTRGPLFLQAIGKCPMPHCFCGHAFLALGSIPELETPSYARMRDRVTQEGEHWLKEDCRAFFDTRLCQANAVYTEKQKRRALRSAGLLKVRGMAVKVVTRLGRAGKKDGNQCKN